MDTGYWILDTGYWILDTGYWILDTGYWILVIRQLCWLIKQQEEKYDLGYVYHTQCYPA